MWLWALLPVLLGWLAGNLAGWWITAPGPFNWRVLIHSSIYLRWLDTDGTLPID